MWLRLRSGGRAAVHRVFGMTGAKVRISPAANGSPGRLGAWMVNAIWERVESVNSWTIACDAHRSGVAPDTNQAAIASVCR